MSHASGVQVGLTFPIRRACLDGRRCRKEIEWEGMKNTFSYRCLVCIEKENGLVGKNLFGLKKMN